MNEPFPVPSNKLALSRFFTRYSHSITSRWGISLWRKTTWTWADRPSHFVSPRLTRSFKGISYTSVILRCLCRYKKSDLTEGWITACFGFTRGKGDKIKIKGVSTIRVKATTYEFYILMPLVMVLFIMMTIQKYVYNALKPTSIDFTQYNQQCCVLQGQN